jgi:hypothetical protein
MRAFVVAAMIVAARGRRNLRLSRRLAVRYDFDDA